MQELEELSAWQELSAAAGTLKWVKVIADGVLKASDISEKYVKAHTVFWKIKFG